MKIKKYEELGGMALDALKEIGSIGSGNAATALSQVLNKTIGMSLPEVQILEFNEAVRRLGGAETIVTGVLVEMSGEIKGIMLFLQHLDFINIVLGSVLSENITTYEQLDEMAMSAVTEIGNIIISSYVSAISKLTDISVNLSVPAVSLNMLGAIISVPMAEYGHISDKIMVVDGKFRCDNQEVYSNLLMLPDVESLNYLMEKLGVRDE